MRNHVLAQHAEKINNLNLYDWIAYFKFGMLTKSDMKYLESCRTILQNAKCTPIWLILQNYQCFRLCHLPQPKASFLILPNFHFSLIDFTIKAQVIDFSSRLCFSKAFPLLIFIWFQIGCNFFYDDAQFFICQ